MSSNNDNDVTVNEVVQRMQKFSVIDYGILIGMLGLSSAIGIYFGIREKQKNQRLNRRHDSIEMDYMVGGRKMKIFPIAMSLVASWLSGLALLGLSAEIYTYGTDFALLLISIVLAAICLHFLFIPVYMDLKITSLNEYLEARFDRKMRYMGAFIFILNVIFNMPILLYATAMAFNQVSGIGIHTITTITCLICIFYTTLGGMKAVVWTDVIQTLIMKVTLILIVVKGTIQIGGFNTVWHRNYESGRIELPSFTLDPTVRHSFFAFVIGGTFQACQNIAGSQMFIQRYVSLPSKSDARKALWLSIITVLIVLSLCFYSGLLIYATYYDCDPVTTKLAQSREQLLPVFVLDVLNDIPGITGLFISGIFSATLSTLSTALNSVSTVILVDFIKIWKTKPLTTLATNIILRGFVLITGVICIALVFIVAKFDAVFQLKITITSCTSGPLFGIFLIGLLLPWLNSNSTLFGGAFSLIVMTWITLKSQLAILSKELVFKQKPTATYGCTYNYTSITKNSVNIAQDPVTPQIYHVSYLWYVLIGATITIITASLASFVFGRQNPHDVNPVLLAPFIRKYFKGENHQVKLSNESCALNSKTSCFGSIK